MIRQMSTRPVRTASSTPDSQSHDTGWRRAFQIAAAVFCYGGGFVPLCWLLAFYGFIVRVRFAAGVWPTPFSEFGHSSFPFPLHGMLVGDGSFLLPFLFVSWVVSSGGFSLIGPAVISFRRFLCLLAIWLASAVLVFTDPGQFIDWYFFYSN